MKVYTYLKQLSETPVEERDTFIESMKMRSYSSPEVTETDIWILTTANENAEYLESKLKEADELSLDTEAPAEVSSEEELTLDAPTEDTPAEGGEELSLDAPAEEAPTDSGEELSLDTPAEGGEELSLDAPAEEAPTDSGEELSLDAPAEETDATETTEETPAEEKEEIETSKAGIGILSLIGEIQEKLANGKPSEVELAALKALKKLVG
jgi:hypothetical protein